MQNRIFKTNIEGMCANVLAIFLFMMLFTAQSFAQLQINGLSADPDGYEPGSTNNIDVTVVLEDPTSAEYADYLIFTFPAGFQVSLDPTYDLAAISSFCGLAVVSGEGTNEVIIGNDDPMGAPVGDSDCGAIAEGTYTIPFEVTVPATVTGDQSFNLNALGDGWSHPVAADVNESFTLQEILCMLTCSPPVIADSDPGECGATLTIPAPTFVGLCLPAPTDFTGFFPVGTTEVTFDAGISICVVSVTVNDAEMPTLDPIADMSFDLDGGECGQVVTYFTNGADACGDADVLISQSNTANVVNNSLACPGGGNIYSRVFDLAAEGQFTDVSLTNIELGIFQSFNSPEVTVRISELDGALTSSNLTLVAESTMTLPDLFVEFFDFPIAAELDANATYVVQVLTPGSIFNGFVMGTNSDGETGTSYLESSFCSVPEFSDMNTFGAGQQNLLINLEGTSMGTNVEQTAGLPSGSYFPIGTTTNTFVVTDNSGNTSELSFDVTVNAFGDPIANLACNNVINVSLGEDCMALINADMVLEGGPYACYDEYEVVIIDEDGNESFGFVDGSHVGQELTVEVRDSSGNLCWGVVVIEDKLPPVLMCTTNTTQCDAASTDPGAAISERIRFAFDNPPNNTIDVGAPSSADIPLEVEGLNGATITDLNIDLDISHTWINDLGVSLISPEGTEVIVILQPACIGEDMIVTLDDSADEPLDNGCTANIPAIEGTYLPFGDLSDFIGEDPNGTWILRVSDFFNGDGGVVNNVALEITQSGGAIGFPIPDGATIIPTGDNTYTALGLDPCGPTTLTYEDEVTQLDCSSPFTQQILRTYTAVDENGNNAVSCTDTINVLRTDLSTLEFPSSYDDIDLPSLSCTSGYPTPDVTGRPTGDFCENVEMSYEDVTLDICEGSYKILRYWSVYEWCNSEVQEGVQIIKVTDETGPSISIPQVGDLSTSPSSCLADLLLPQPSISDNCTSNPTYMIEASAGTLVQQGQNFFLNNLEIGTVTVTYTAFDDCGNSGQNSIDITVGDEISPVAICDQHTTVALSFDDQVTVEALTFDDGSYDECTPVTFAVRRMTDNCGVAGNTAFSSSVVFCCADVGQTTMVEFRVTDEFGNSNTCMVEVDVQDKIAPALQAPADVTLDCQADFTDLNLTGGLALGFDNCDLNPVTFTDNVSIGSCGSGQVVRTFTVTDKSGLSSADQQFIFLVNNDEFDINNISFPNNVTLTSCNDSTDPADTGEPIIQDDACSQVSFTYWDDVFEIADGACLQIYRKWTVIDQCQFNPAIGLGIWEDIQVIEVINNVAPEFTTSCSNVVIDAYGSCNGQVSLEVDATDDCTDAEDLTYSWKIDLFNNGNNVFDIEGNGKSVNNTFDVGTHRIIWTVLDNCGNQDICDYLFTVRDAKKPTPYCISSLSTAVMNNDGTVVIWASDFDLGATDNCTAPGDLTISFTEFGVTTSREFSCDDIASGVSQLIDDINIWVTDEAGNKDFCTVSLLVEDNEANFCDDIGTLTVGGALENVDGNAIKNVDLIATNAIGIEFQSATSTATGYAFDLLPNMNYTISADKDTDPLNGITVIDIVLIQRHILAITSFDTPYKTIAADVDNNEKINGLDIIQIRKLLLGINTEFSNGQRPWRFVKKDQEFDGNFNVFPYEESIEIDFTGDMMSNDFVGVKIADINGSADPDELISDADTRNNSTLDFVIDNQQFSAGEIIEIPVTADNFGNVLAYQMTLEYNPSTLEMIDLIPGELDLRESDVNMAYAQNGYITCVWGNVDAVETEGVLFTLVATAKREGTLHNAFSTSDRLTRTLSYSSLEEPGGIEWSVRENGVDVTEVTELTHSNAPNPFSDFTTISFDLPTSTSVLIQVYDMEGKEVIRTEQAFAAGRNTFEITNSMLKGTGVYYYSLTTANESASGKMILID